MEGAGWTWLFSHSVMSDSLRPDGLQHARLPSPSPTPRVCSNSCPLSRWCNFICSLHQPYVRNRELTDVQAGLEKAEEPEIKLPTSAGSSKRQENFRITSTSALLTMLKPLTVWIMTNWKILQEMGIPDHLTCLLRNLYAGQEGTVRTGHGTMEWFQIGKGVYQGCVLLPCLFNLYAEYIMRNARLDEAQAGIKIAGRNTNNLRYADDTTLW